MIGARLREILFFFRTNVVALLAVTLPFAVVASLVVHNLGEPITLEKDQLVPHWQSALALALVYPLALAAKVVAIHRLARGDAVMTGTALVSLLADSLRLWPAFAGISLVTGLAVGSGFFLFILPGVWFYARFGFAPIVAVTGRLGAMEALVASWQRSQDRQIELLTLVLLIGGALVLVMLLVFGLLAQGEASPSLGADMAARGINELLFCLLTIAFYRLWSLGEQPP